MQQKASEVLSAIFHGGVVAATIDIGAASLISGRSPAFIMQAIAGGDVVVPLSAWKSAPHFTTVKLAENMAAMLLFGLIVAFFCRRIGVRAELTSEQAATAA